VVNYRLFISIWIFRINSLDNFILKKTTSQQLKKQKNIFKSLGESIKNHQG